MQLTTQQERVQLFSADFERLFAEFPQEETDLQLRGDQTESAGDPDGQVGQRSTPFFYPRCTKSSHEVAKKR